MSALRRLLRPRAADAVADDPRRLARRLAARPSGWTPEERGRDFRAVFGGGATPEQGARVLAQIAAWAGLLAPVHVPGDPWATHVRAGAQALAQRILATLDDVPPRASPFETWPDGRSSG
ncbi:MAG: hypothetical protein AB7N54_13110 [Alphaproteobacteria bacterium]